MELDEARVKELIAEAIQEHLASTCKHRWVTISTERNIDPKLNIPDDTITLEQVCSLCHLERQVIRRV